MRFRFLSDPLAGKYNTGLQRNSIYIFVVHLGLREPDGVQLPGHQRYRFSELVHSRTRIRPCGKQVKYIGRVFWHLRINPKGHHHAFDKRARAHTSAFDIRALFTFIHTRIQYTAHALKCLSSRSRGGFFFNITIPCQKSLITHALPTVYLSVARFPY